MTIGQAIVYGVVQGLTEYLPISSTAHLRIVPALCGWEDPGAPFTAVIQLGTLVAVLAYFSRDIAAITRGMWVGVVTRNPWGSVESRLGWLIAAGTVPIVVCGVGFQDSIETTLRSLYVISASLIVLALFLWGAEALLRVRLRRGEKLKQLEDLGWKEVILVGLAQVIALVPGSSRSGVTITAGLLLGMTRETAARFSFLLSLPSVFAAGVFQFWEYRKEFWAAENGVLTLALATVVSAVVGYASIAFLLRFLKRHTTYLFIVYRLLLGALVLALIGMGRVAAG